MLPPAIRGYMLVALGLVAPYILFRTIYWSSLQGAIIFVRPLTEEEIPHHISSEYNLFWDYHIAAYKYAIGEPLYMMDIELR